MDEIVPQRFFIEALERFGKAFPETELELLYGALKDIQTLVEEGRVDMGLLAPIDFPDRTVSSRLAAYLPFCPVSFPEHHLAGLEEIAPTDMEPHRQLIVTSRGG